VSGGGAAADEVLRDVDGVVSFDPDDTTVQQLVVERAEGERVGHFIRAFGCPPTNVGSFDANRLPHELTVVPADRTPVFVGQQDLLSKCRVSPPLLGPCIPG
jgi:hypothetical protein